MTTRASRAFTILRGILWSAVFVLLWGWLAVAVRRFDPRIAIAIPVWFRVPGIALGLAGAVLAAACIATFVTRGSGTPAPFDPPRVFVASGPYRYVRNPMYVGAIGVLLGAGLALPSPAIVLLTLAFFVSAHVFVVVYEEPTLARKFGDSYLQYKAGVSRWIIKIPRVKS